MKKILAITINDIRREFSSAYTLIFFLVLPIVFTVATGVGLGGIGGDQTDVEDTRFAFVVVDEDNSHLSQQLFSVLEESDVVRPVYKTADKAAQLFAEESTPAVLAIPAGFEENLFSGEKVNLQLLELPSANQALTIEEAVRAGAARLNSSLAAALASADMAHALRPFESDAERAQYLSEGYQLASAITAQPSVELEVTRASTANMATATGFEQGSVGQLVTWTLITLIGAAEVFVDERVGGTFGRLLTTPTPRAVILSGKLLGRLLMGLFQMALLIAFGLLVLKVPWGNSPLALVLILVAFALSAVGMGTLAGTFLKTRSQAGWVTIMLSMLTAALGGAWWPLEITPASYQAAVRVLPTTWAMTGLSDVIVRGLGVQDILPEVGVLLGFALVFFVLGIWRLSRE